MEYLDPPRSLRIAVRLMYAGAALTALGAAADIAGVHDEVRSAHPHATAAQLQVAQHVLVVALAAAALLEICLWLFVSRVNRSGLRWGRITASVLCAVYSGYLAYVLAGSDPAAGKAVTALIWLAGAGAVFFLWRNESTVYFDAPTAPAGASPA